MRICSHLETGGAGSRCLIDLVAFRVTENALQGGGRYSSTRNQQPAAGGKKNRIVLSCTGASLGGENQIIKK